MDQRLERGLTLPVKTKKVFFIALFYVRLERVYFVDPYRSTTEKMQ